MKFMGLQINTKYTLCSFLVALLISSLNFLQLGCAQPAGKYYEEIAPAGNPLVETQQEAVEKKLTEADLPETIRQLVEIIAPGPKVFDVEKKQHSNKVFIWDVEIELKKIDAYFDIELWPDGRIHEIDSWTKKYGREQAGRIFDEGEIEEISPTQVPRPLIEKASHFAVGRELTKAFKVNARKGKRFFIQFGNEDDATILSLSPEGQILAAHSAKYMLRPFKPEEKESPEDYAYYLDSYKDKYNVRNTIRRVQQVPFNSTKGFRFVVIGDSRSNMELWQTIIKNVNKFKPLFAINVGDMVRHGYAKEFAEYLFPVLDDYAKYPFLPIMGNHDRGDDGAQYEYVFGGDSSRTYFFDYGNCRFVILDNGASGGFSWEEQLEMADKWLSEVPNYRRFVFLHAPPREVQKWAYHSMGVSLSQPFVALMSKHQVDHVFCGHIHAYSTATYNGVNYTVTGGAGAGLHQRYGELGSVHHYVLVDVLPDGINMQVVRFYPGEDG